MRFTTAQIITSAFIDGFCVALAATKFLGLLNVPVLGLTYFLAFVIIGGAVLVHGVMGRKFCQDSADRQFQQWMEKDDDL